MNGREYHLYHVIYISTALRISGSKEESDQKSPIPMPVLRNILFPWGTHQTDNTKQAVPEYKHLSKPVSVWRQRPTFILHFYGISV